MCVCVCFFMYVYTLLCPFASPWHTLTGRVSQVPPPVMADAVIMAQPAVSLLIEGCAMMKLARTGGSSPEAAVMNDPDTTPANPGMTPTNPQECTVASPQEEGKVTEESQQSPPQPLLVVTSVRTGSQT